MVSSIDAWFRRALQRLASTGRPARQQYARVWNAMSRTEHDAKMAVTGYVDEAIYAKAGQDTVDLLNATVGIGREDVVLEIGAGVGRVGAALAPVCREWIGGDVSDNMVAHMRERLKPFPNARPRRLNGYNLWGIEAGSIDVVYSTVVFMHLEEWDRYNYVREGFRVLRPGGRMLVDNFNLLSEPGWAMFEGLAGIPPLERPAQISKASTPQELETYFRRAGFERIEQRTDDLWLYTFGIKPGGA